MRLYIGCGPRPFHPQHLEVLGEVTEWTLIDKYVNEPGIKNWDGRYLKEVKDGTVDHIYSSHTLEHFEHGDISKVLETWYQKLKSGGKLTLNVPDLLWAMKLLQRIESGSFIEGYYNTYAGEHGVMSILYGSQSHDGEYHKSGYTVSYLEHLLKEARYTDIDISQIEDGHDMGVIIATCRK